MMNKEQMDSTLANCIRRLRDYRDRRQELREEMYRYDSWQEGMAFDIGNLVGEEKRHCPGGRCALCSQRIVHRGGNTRGV